MLPGGRLRPFTSRSKRFIPASRRTYESIQTGHCNLFYARVKLVGKVKEGFRQVYLVEAVPKGGAAENLYFDVESGLLVRRDVTRSTPKGPVRVEVYFNDWRDVDGVKLPFKITQILPKTRLVMTFEDIKQNVAVDDALFVRP